MYGRGFKQTALLSIGFAVFSVVGGILTSYVFDITPSGTIVIVSIAILAITMSMKSLGIIK